MKCFGCQNCDKTFERSQEKAIHVKLYHPKVTLPRKKKEAVVRKINKLSPTDSMWAEVSRFGIGVFVFISP